MLVVGCGVDLCLKKTIEEGGGLLLCVVIHCHHVYHLFHVGRIALEARVRVGRGGEIALVANLVLLAPMPARLPAQPGHQLLLLLLRLLALGVDCVL